MVSTHFYVSAVFAPGVVLGSVVVLITAGVLDSVKVLVKMY